MAWWARGIGAVAVAAAVGMPSVAAADDGSEAARSIPHYAETVVLDADGTAHVTVDLTFDFGGEPGHGPFLTVPEQEPTDDGRTRAYEVSNVTAVSPSGAPADVQVDDDGQTATIRVGDPDVGDVDGVQTYRIGYDVSDLVDPDATTGDGDQLYWDAIGTAWQVPLGDVSIDVSGPADVERVECFAGTSGSAEACDAADQVGGHAVFHQASVEPGDGLTVAVGWPAGTFPDASPVFVDDQADDGSAASSVDGSGSDIDDDLAQQLIDGGTSGYDDGEIPGSTFFGLGAGGLVALLVGGFVVIAILAVRRSSRPGAKPEQPTAEVHELARRGYLRIDRTKSAGQVSTLDWNLVPLRPADSGLSQRERAWYVALFGAGMVPVAWSNATMPPIAMQGFWGGGGGSAGFGFGGDGGAGAGVGGGGGFGGGGSVGGGDGGGGGGGW